MLTAKHRTITTSIGETLELIMRVDGVEISSLRWKKDGGSNIMEWDGLSNVTVENVRKKDAGIYECYPEGQRDQGQHAIVRVLVRECPQGKWLHPNCEINCPICYNGGVCSDQFGSCICPPGFTGDNCEEACGYNNWGRECNIICSSSKRGCPNVMFCLPDPFGCSCMSGYGDTDCSQDCDTGTTGNYGPGCLLDCHCDAAVCQPSEGCNEGVTCHTGYTGSRCLERDPNVECPGGFYGEQCTKICHCEDSSNCNRNSGNCPVGDACKEGWAGEGCQQGKTDS
ncbi:multiple epidermal growth factor-like domains protein 10 [Anneissia japonica]|uniref:multiple epidermal growth factor-like domains protein 10 n=1 Tax=Anneissia japonica TaxID=1529436 RepID=UPI001425744F|nr:multiple epidermal growth factor-like domains protein 10 [Anneissia japonica]